MQVKVVILNTMFEGAFKTPQIVHVHVPTMSCN